MGTERSGLPASTRGCCAPSLPFRSLDYCLASLAFRPRVQVCSRCPTDICSIAALFPFCVYALEVGIPKKYNTCILLI